MGAFNENVKFGRSGACFSIRRNFSIPINAEPGRAKVNLVGWWLVVGSLLRRGGVGKNGRVVKIGSMYGDRRDKDVDNVEAVERLTPAHAVVAQTTQKRPSGNSVSLRVTVLAKSRPANTLTRATNTNSRWMRGKTKAPIPRGLCAPIQPARAKTSGYGSSGSEHRATTKGSAKALNKPTQNKTPILCRVASIAIGTTTIAARKRKAGKSRNAQRPHERGRDLRSQVGFA